MCAMVTAGFYIYSKPQQYIRVSYKPCLFVYFCDEHLFLLVYGKKSVSSMRLRRQFTDHLTGGCLGL